MGYGLRAGRRRLTRPLGQVRAPRRGARACCAPTAHASCCPWLRCTLPLTQRALDRRYVYDTAWLYAHALKRLAEAGTSPHDGEALLAALLATSFEGVTGRLEISPADQDRVQGFQLHSLVPENLNASAARNSSAVSTAPLVDVVAANISYLWWPLGYVPSDGSSADAASCSLEWPLGQEVFVGQSATLSVSLNNAFRRPVTAADATVNITIVGDQSCARVMPLPTATAPVGSSASSIRAFTVELLEVGTCAIRVHVKHGAPPPAFIGAIELSVSQETLPDILFGLTLTLVLLALAVMLIGAYLLQGP